MPTFLHKEVKTTEQARGVGMESAFLKEGVISWATSLKEAKGVGGLIKSPD